MLGKNVLYKYLSLIRVNNLIIIIITQLIIKVFIIGRYTRWGNVFQDSAFFVLNLSTVLIAAAGYIINDYYDIKIDLLNKPDKLVVGKFISRRMAITWHLTLSIIGILLGFYNGYLIGLMHIISAFLLWLYSNKLKRLPLIGNIVVALLSGLSVMLVALYYRHHYTIILSYSIFAFFISFIREILKDLEDIKGDAVFGCRTLPIVWGYRKTKNFVNAIILVFIITLLLLTHQLSGWVIAYLIFAVVFPLLFIWFRLKKADTLKDFRTLSFYCKILMGTGLGSILFINS